MHAGGEIISTLDVCEAVTLAWALLPSRNIAKVFAEASTTRHRQVLCLLYHEVVWHQIIVETAQMKNHVDFALSEGPSFIAIPSCHERMDIP